MHNDTSGFENGWTTGAMRALVAGLLVCLPACGGEGATDSQGEDSDSVEALGTVATKYGASTGGDTPTMLKLLGPKIIRVYESGSPTALGGQALTVPKGIAMHYSCKPDMPKLAAKNAALIADLKHVFASIPEVAGSRATIVHEFDNNGGADTPAVYQAGWKVFLSDVLAPVNAKRNIRLISVAITTPVPYFNGTMDKWYVPGADEIGTDAYSSRGVTEAATYAKAKHKPWCMPEYGYTIDANGTDLEVLARMKHDHAFWSGVTNPPRAVMFYDARGNSLDDKPKAAAYWKALSQ